MRAFGFGHRRNAPYRLTPANPLPRYDDAQDTGNAGKDGFSTLSRADPQWAGSPPDVAGTEGQAFGGPDRSFEQ